MASKRLMDLLCPPAERGQVERWLDHFRVVETEPAGEFHLRFNDGRLSLCRIGDETGVAVSGRDVRHRIRGDFLLGRACGVKPGTDISILDGTAGLGLDGIALALAGGRVTLVEREPVLWALLTNLLDRLVLHDVCLHLNDVESLLDEAEAPEWDVIYLDPMFPVRNKKALPAKRMQYLAAVLEGCEPFDPALIEQARRFARSRVVLKRRLKDPAYGAPGWQIRGRSVRYDVYQGRG
jgi:16S rRNA (guanine1516-N2)-methyltransferase